MNRFSAETLAFLSDLKANNNRVWFQENKNTYETVVKRPAAKVSAALEAEIEALTGEPHSTKIFRINRDIRFSKDKTPYNSHIHILFSPVREAPIKPSWFFGLNTERLTLGSGIFEIPKDHLEGWRERIAGKDGEELQDMLAKLQKQGARLPEPALKRVPKPYAADHPRAELLKRKGLAVWFDFEGPEAALEENAPKTCAGEFKKLLPLARWLAR